MVRFAVASAVYLALGISSVAAPLDGAKIAVQGGSPVPGAAPVTLQLEGAEVEGPVAVSREGESMRYPATVRGGELTFMIPGGASGTYVVHRGGPGDAVAITKRGGEDVLDVTVDGEGFTAYHYPREGKKPFLWPVLAEGAVGITRDWPMGDAVESADHPHHKSFWTAYGDVNGADCWGEGGKSGFQRSGKVTWGSGDAYGWIRAENVWESGERKPVVNETREYRFYNTPAAARLFDISVTFSADYGDVKFGDTKEGGIVGIRMHDALRERGGNGTITTGAGAAGAAQAWGKPAPWCDYSGTMEGYGARGITVFDHPTNLRHPTSWHVRDYGLLGANCFGYSYFTRGKENGDYLLNAGETLTFNYRLYVHSGDVTEAHVADHFARYSEPPEAHWVE